MPQGKTACPEPVARRQGKTACPKPVAMPQGKTACPEPVAMRQGKTACPEPVVMPQGKTAPTEAVVIRVTVPAQATLLPVLTSKYLAQTAGGKVLLKEVRNSYLHAESRLLAAVGVTNLAIIETPDAVLVARRDQLGKVKELVTQLEAAGHEQATTHTLVPRPWGSYQSLAIGPGYQVKHIVVHPGAALSLQLHHHRAEHWTVIRGSGQVTRDDDRFTLNPNESTFIPLGSKHRLANAGPEPLEIIEVQLGDYLGEDDIVRFDDKYGRVSAN